MKKKVQRLIKKKMDAVSQQIWELSGEIDAIKQNQMEIL